MPGIVPEVTADGLGDGDPPMSMPGMLGLIVGGVEPSGVEPTGCPQAATMVASATRAVTVVRRRVM